MNVSLEERKMQQPNLTHLSIVEKWLGGWLDEPARWKTALQRLHGNATLTSAWRNFGTDLQYHAVLQIIYGEFPESLNSTGGPYLMRLAKGTLYFRHSLDLEPPEKLRAQYKSKQQTITEGIVSAGSVINACDPDLFEYVTPMSSEGVPEALVLRINRMDHDSDYKEGQELRPETTKWLLDQFKPMYGKGGRF